MSRSIAATLGMASLLLFSVLTVTDIEGAYGLRPIPQALTTFMLMLSGIFANAFFTYRIVRGKRPQPPYTRKELRAIIQEAVGEQLRTEIETVLGQIFRMNMLSGSTDTTPPAASRPRPHIVKAREGD